MNELSLIRDAEEGPHGNLLEQLPPILRQRRWWIIVPTGLGALGALLAILLIPAVYQSTAVMLVQSPQLPREVIGNLEGELVERRIARIRQQVTSRPSLLSLIERHGLYPEQRRSKPLSDIISSMREAIVLTPMTTTAPGPAGQSAVAFQLSYEYSQPAAAQAVTQDLMDSMLDLEYRGSIGQATSTVQFLTDQANELEQRIAEVQGEIAGINARNGGILGNGNTLLLGGDTTSYDVQIAALQRDNASLLAQRDVAQSSDERDPIVTQAETALAAARAVYTENHPDVIVAKQRLAEARELAKENTGKLPLDAIDQQMAFNNSQIAALRSAKEQQRAQTNARLAAQARAPLVQQQISDLQRRLALLNGQYEEVRNQLLAATADVKAEDEQMGERLSVVEPPIVPDSPVWPNRLLIGGLGLGGGLALGLLLAFAVELMARPIRDPNTLKAITGAAPLAVVPVIGAPRPTRSKGWRDLIPWRRSPSWGEQ